MLLRRFALASTDEERAERPRTSSYGIGGETRHPDREDVRLRRVEGDVLSTESVVLTFVGGCLAVGS